MNENETHKVVVRREGMREMVFFSGTFKECVFYVMGLMWDAMNPCPIEEYEIMKW